MRPRKGILKYGHVRNMGGGVEPYFEEMKLQRWIFIICTFFSRIYIKKQEISSVSVV